MRDHTKKPLLYLQYSLKMTANQTEVFNHFYTNKSRTDSSEHLEDLQGLMAQIFKAIAYVVIMALSLGGNTLVLIVVKKNIGGHMRSIRNCLLTSMAATDLLITVGNMPERLTRVLTNDEWLIQGALGTALCKTTNFIEKLCLGVSILNLVLVATDRYLAVMFPHKKYFTSRRAFLTIGLVWLLSALYCSPILYYGGLLKEQEKTLCKVRRFFPHWKAWYLPFLVQLLLTLVIVLVLYVLILNKLLRRKFRHRIGLARSDSFSTNEGTRDAKINRRVLKMVAAILIAFYVCFLPYWIGWVFCSYHYSKLICNDTYIFISIYLSYANSTLNPLIYCVFSESFRQAFKLVARETCPWVSTCSRAGGVHPRVSALDVQEHELSPGCIMQSDGGEHKEKGKRIGSNNQEV